MTELRSRRRRRALRWVSLCLLAGAALALASAAWGETITSKAPIVFSATNPCTGEVLSGTGFAHFVLTGNLSGGGMVRSHIEGNFENVKAVAAVTGARYVAPSSETQGFVFDSDGAPANETFEADLAMVRQGEDGTLFPDDDFHLHVLGHATANANGIVTVQRLTVEARCDQTPVL